MQHDPTVRRLKITTAVYFAATLVLGVGANSLSTVLLGLVVLGLLFVATIVLYVLRGEEEGTLQVDQQLQKQETDAG
jgi:hypothetical protein